MLKGKYSTRAFVCVRVCVCLQWNCWKLQTKSRKSPFNRLQQYEQEEGGGGRGRGWRGFRVRGTEIGIHASCAVRGHWRLLSFVLPTFGSLPQSATTAPTADALECLDNQFCICICICICKRICFCASLSVCVCVCVRLWCARCFSTIWSFSLFFRYFFLSFRCFACPSRVEQEQLSELPLFPCCQNFYWM